MPPFSEWTLEDAIKAIKEATESQVHGGYDANRKFVEDRDHWQDGVGWMGPVGDESRRAEVLQSIHRQFTPRDTIGEVLDRMANGMLQQSIDVDFIPIEPVEEPEFDDEVSEEDRAAALAEFEEARAEQQMKAENLKAIVSKWTRERRLKDRVRHALKRSRWATRGALRVWLPPAHLVAKEGDGGTQTTVLPKAPDLAEALSYLQVSAPLPDRAIVVTDEESAERAAVFVYQDESGKNQAELWYVDGDTTVLKTLGSDEEARTYSLPLGNRLPIAEMQADLLITDAVRRQQHRLNFFESLIVRVGETAGFPERYTTNAEPNGIWSQSVPTNGPPLSTQTDDQGRMWYLHPVHRTLGAAITTELVGLLDEGGESGPTRQSPSVVFKDPTDPEYATKVTDHAYHAILNECKQEHIALQRTGEASGTAYQQARADFEADLNGIRDPAQDLIRRTLESALVWAAHMSADDQSIDQFRVSVTLTVNTGPVTTEEQSQNNANVDAGTLSRSSAMAANGVDDVDAELAKIDAEPSAVADLRAKQITMLTELRGDGSDGMTWERAAKIVGIDDEVLIKELQAADSEADGGGAQESAQDDEIDAILSGTEIGV